jgi:beta-glucanase (GH16 family)
MSKLCIPHFARRAILGLATGLVLCCANAATALEPALIKGKNFTLVKDWTFGVNITSLDQLRNEFFTRYVYAMGTLDTLNDEWQLYRDNDNHVLTPSGLDLVARVPTTLEKGKIESGMLRSKWSGKYGYYEARIKVPKGRGMWPAFWLNPQDAVWPPEIDIMEIANNGRDTTRNSFHFVHAGNGKRYTPWYSLVDAYQSYRPAFDYADGYHTFAVLWEPGRVRHYVDGKNILDQRFDWLHRNNADAGTAHVLLNLAVGGSWPGAPETTSDFPARMSIEFVRVWQKDKY